MGLTLLAFSLGMCALVVGATIGLGRARHWSMPLQILAAIVSLALTIVALIVGLILGFLGPVEAFSMQWKLRALERQLYVGESRANIERQFGYSIPKPERLGGYSVSGAEAVPGWADHLGQYSYFAEGAFCVADYEGVVVYYDSHDRVKWWKRYSSADGC